MLKPRAHYVFNYQPRYYDARKERIQNLVKEQEENNRISDKSPKLHLSKEQLKSDWKRQKKVASDKGVNRRLAIIITILVGILAYLFEIHKLF